MASALKHTHLQKPFTRSFTNTHSLTELGLRGKLLLLPVVAELNGRALEHAAECDGLDLPVRYWVAEQADAGVHSLLAVESWWAEVFCPDGGDLVDVEVDHLEKSWD